MQQDVWLDCQKQLIARTQNMRSVVWLTTNMPEVTEPESNPPLNAEQPSVSEGDVIMASNTNLPINTGLDAEVPPAPILFSLNFNAKDLYNKDLHYQGFCNYRTLEDFSIKIRPRR